jgi:hypothetical protein
MPQARVTAAGTGLVVVLVSGISSTTQFELTLDERLAGTAIGATLALGLGIAVPRALQRFRGPAGPQY